MHLTETVKVSDFQGQSFDKKFGFVQNGDQVEYMWCEICTKVKDEVTRQMQIRGKVKDDQPACTKQQLGQLQRGRCSLRKTKFYRQI